MSRVTSLAAAGRSAAAKFHELRLKYWNPELDVTCCFEGKDDVEFYLPHVRRQLGLHDSRIDFVICGGKRVVLCMWKWAQEKLWNLARLGFFVDRDLDDYLNGNPSGPQLFITDHYSIESHIIDPNIFDHIWQDVFRLSITDSRRVYWRTAYYSGAQQLARLLLPVTCVAVAVKRRSGEVAFDRLRITELVTLSESLEVKRRRCGAAFSYADVFLGAEPTLTEIRRARCDLQGATFESWVRGKFLLWYAMLFLSRMKMTLGSRLQTNRAIVRGDFNAETAMACLCGRMSVPDSLSRFLVQWSAAIVEGGLVPSGASNRTG